MDWANEHWVKLYIRNTPDWMGWPWQSRAIFPLLMRQCDRAGQIALGRVGIAGLAAVLGMPIDVTQAGIDGLISDGCVTQRNAVVTVENFVEAQEAVTSNKERQQRLRDRRKLLKYNNVTVTRRNAASRDVTTRVDVIRVEESRIESKDSVASPLGAADLVFDYWRSVHRPNARVFDQKTRKAVEARLAEGFTEGDLKRAIDGCKASPHHQGKNDNGKKYDSLELICRDGGKVHTMQGYLERGVGTRKPGYQEVSESYKNDPTIHPRDLWKLGLPKE